MNCRSPAKLPLHIEKFMNDSGDDGVILVSFGTVLQASQMSESLRLKLISVLGKVKQRVLMKWENEEEMMAADQFPANMMLSKWLPQQDILAHPKLRLFITHGGQSSRVLERRAPERCAPERRSECRSDGRSGAPQIELERYPERRSEKGRSSFSSTHFAPLCRLVGV